MVLDIEGTDRYGRWLATVYVMGRDINHALVQAGYAWHYDRYSNRAATRSAEAEARAASRGLWAGENPVAPWVWRHNDMASRGRSSGVVQPVADDLQAEIVDELMDLIR